MGRNPSRLIARALGGSVGLGLAVAIVMVARPAASADGLTATVRFSIPVSGELTVTPAAPKPVLVAAGLRPGGNRAAGSFKVHNQTGRTMPLDFHARPSSAAINGLLQVRLSAAGRTLVRTSLQDMVRGGGGTLRLRSGATRQLTLAAWMPAGVGSGYEGRVIDVSLVPRSLSGGAS
ncbi:MAG: hypothetical protein QOJ38_1970 [Solirubrobacterales bacterium]|nr:hypothetical protein [Solirubrobacterales bacterium]